jgi:hypothetical protein
VLIFREVPSVAGGGVTEYDLNADVFGLERYRACIIKKRFPVLWYYTQAQAGYH